MWLARRSRVGEHDRFTAERARIEWMDFVRGAAIIALLVWHASSIPTVYQNATMPIEFVHLNNFFAPYRMPVLMFLSGMLLARSLRRPLGEYYSGKLRKLLWPYLVWAVIYLGATQQLSLFLHPQTWIPVTYIWFLLFVFLYYCAAPVVARFPPIVVPAVAIIVSMAIADHGFISKFVLFAAYFFLGHQLSSSTAARKLTMHAAVRWSALVVTVVLNVAGPHGWPLVSTITTLTGIIAVVGWFQRFYGARQRRSFVENIGVNSIVYYLSHFPLMIGVGALLSRFDVTSFYLGFGVNLVAAVAVGWLLTTVRLWPPAMILFEFPKICRSVRSGSRRSE